MSIENKLKNLTYDKFKELATDDTLTLYERIGFYNHLREHKEEEIFQDILQKLPNLNLKNKVILDIGCGCSALPNILIEHCKKNNHTLILNDSSEMLDLLPNEEFIVKISGKFPTETNELLNEYKGKTDVIISYSVFHYVFMEMPYMDFIDQSLGLLKQNGQMLLGDLPNHSKKNRFFSSETGITFHKKNNNTDMLPVIDYNAIPFNTIDDGVIFGIMQRARMSGIESYLLPQSDSLPFGNRREDLLFFKY